MKLNTFQISKCIENKDFSTAEVAITDFIRSNTDAKDTLEVPTNNSPLEAQSAGHQEQVYYTLCEQFVTLITQLFSAPGYKPSFTTINVFLSYKFVVEWLFSASLWKNTDALIEHLQLIQTDRLGNLKLNKKRITLLLMLITLSSKFKLPWKVLFKTMPAQALSSYIGLVTQPIPAISKESDAGFNYALESAKGFPMFDLPVVEDLGKFNFPFFACSYATSPDKYEFKKWLTKLIRHNLPQWLSPTVKQYIDEMPELKVKPKMKMGVMLELFSKNHAMYRCYKSAIKGLSEHYELIAFIGEKETDNSDLSDFDKVVVVKDLFEINTNAELVLQEKLDIVFYTSIGMSFWGIYLSQLRLAPTQVMALGHPSSSFSPNMDYVLSPFEEHQLTGCQSYFTEKFISSKKSWKSLNNHLMHSELTPDFIEEHNHFTDDSGDIKVAINGVITKVTYDIIEVCKKIQEQSTKKITFVFFTSYSSNHLAFLSTKKQLGKLLNNIELNAYSHYNSYMKQISECHLLLPTLPFGGSNSNIDAMVLNKPKLFIKGDAQLYTRADHCEWTRLDLVEELGCNNTNELVKKAVFLLDNNTSRKALYKIMATKCTLANIFADENKENESYTHLFARLISELEIVEV
jgi:hypothetical protein